MIQRLNTMTKVTIIGAGNMGGAMARALYGFEDIKVNVANPSMQKLMELAEENAEIGIFNDNVKAIKGADVIILAVKPWILPDVVKEIAPRVDANKQIVVSVAGGVDIQSLTNMLNGARKKNDLNGLQIFRVIPNTAISAGAGMTFICNNDEGAESADLVRHLFSLMGEAAEIEERLIDAATALSSCGIAYVFKAIQAAVQAGVQLGFRPADALRYVNATVAGAVALLDTEGATPQGEIDKVTTPGGMTIKGINSLEHDGLPSAIINAILAPVKK